MAAGPIVYTDQAIGTTVDADLGPFVFGNIVIDNASIGMNTFNYPVRLAQRGNKETYALLQQSPCQQTVGSKGPRLPRFLRP